MVETDRLYCLRHGESANVLAGAAGALPMAGLTDRGREQASVAAIALATEPVAGVYASSALRAQQTAEIIAAAHGLRPTIMVDLAEAGIGELEGATDSATRTRTAAVLRSWVVDGDLDPRVADGEDGHAVVDRMTRALTAIVDTQPGATAVVVGHVASLSAALATICHLGTEIWGTPLPFAAPFLVERTPNGWRCPVWPTRPATTDLR
jgi:broad specificity phosphatase PhoE